MTASLGSIGDFLLSWFGTPFGPIEKGTLSVKDVALPLLRGQITSHKRAAMEEALPHVDITKGLDLYEDVKRGTEFNPKRLGHILLDRSAGAGPAAGSTGSEAITWLLDNLEDASVELHPWISPFQGLAKRENELLSGKASPLSYWRDIQALKPGESFFLPGGYIAHYMFYEWIKERDDPPTYTCNVYNSSPQDLIQGFFILNDKFLISPCVSYKHIPESALFSDKGAENDIQRLLTHIYSGTDVKPIYEEYLAHLKPYYVPGGAHLITPQRSGTCGFSALLACLRYHLPLTTYKRFMMEMKMKEFVAAYNHLQNVAGAAASSDGYSLLKQAARSLIHRLEKELRKPPEEQVLPSALLVNFLSKVLLIKKHIEDSEKTPSSTLSVTDLEGEASDIVPPHFVVENSSTHDQLKPFTDYLYCRSLDKDKDDMIIVPVRPFQTNLALAPELKFAATPPPYKYYTYPVDTLTGRLKLESCSQDSALYLATLFLHTHSHYEEAFALIPEKMAALSPKGIEHLAQLSQLSSDKRNLDPQAAAVVLKAHLSANNPIPGEIVILYLNGQKDLPPSLRIAPEKLLLIALSAPKEASAFFPWIAYFQKETEDKVAKMAPGKEKNELIHLLITSYLKESTKNLTKATKYALQLTSSSSAEEQRNELLQLKIAGLLFEQKRYKEAFDLIPEALHLDRSQHNVLRVFLMPFFSIIAPSEAVAIQLKVILNLPTPPSRDLIIQYLFALKSLPPHMILPAKKILPYLEMYKTHPTVAAHLEAFKKSSEDPEYPVS